MAAVPPADPLVLSARLRADYPDLPGYLVARSVAAAHVAATALGAGALTETRLEALSRERLDLLRRRLAPRPTRPRPVPDPDPAAPAAGDSARPAEVADSTAVEPPVNLVLNTLVEADVTVVRIRGDVDARTSPQLRAHFLELVGAARRDLVVDLDEVGFIDSTGLGVLVAVLKRVRAGGGSLRLAFAHERILKIFRITGLDQVFSVHASTAEALADRRAERVSSVEPRRPSN